MHHSGCTCCGSQCSPLKLSLLIVLHASISGRPLRHFGIALTLSEMLSGAQPLGFVEQALFTLAKDLKLHLWDVDGACWRWPFALHVCFERWPTRIDARCACFRCNYKYLNAGPGAIGGFFVHKKHHDKGHSIAPHTSIAERLG